MLHVRFRGIVVGTMDDVNFWGKRVLVRVDVNSPMKGGKLLDASRVEAHARTIRELHEAGAKVVIMAHQGRPGGDDFDHLEQHAKALEPLVGAPVDFVRDVSGPEALRRIDSLEDGELLMLDNVRLLAEENVQAEPEALARTLLVRELAPHFDIYVGDAFAAAHRSQPSIVGFPYVLPSVAGRVMEAELRGLSKVLDVSPRSFFVGGSKVDDVVKVMPSLTAKGTVMTGGLVALAFSKAYGMNLGPAENIVKSMGTEVMEGARKAIEKGKVMVPVDYVVERPDGEVDVEEAGQELSGVPKDIGPSTIAMYRDVIDASDAVIFKGTAGVVEDPRFRRGTVSLLEAALGSGAFVLVGGGHANAALSWVEEGLRKAVGYTSTAGGAMLYLAAGLKMPGVEALAYSYSRFIARGGWP